jgi:hypothetical protein
MKTKLTRESIVESIQGGAKSLSQVAHKHGYQGSVSSGTARTIRLLVPEIADLFAGKTVVAVEAPTGAGKTVTLVTPTAAAHDIGKTAVAAPTVVQVHVADPKAAKKVAKVVTEAVVKQEVRQRSVAPYGGKVYGPVYTEAVLAGKVEVRAFVTATATKLGLDENQVFNATQVIRNPKHQTNMQRSADTAGERGVMQIVAVEAVAVSAE